MEKLMLQLLMNSTFLVHQCGQGRTRKFRKKSKNEAKVNLGNMP